MNKNHQQVEVMVGELPEALRWSYIDNDGAPMVLDVDAVVKVRMRRRNGAVTEQDGTVVDAALGVVGYQWLGSELDVPGVLYLNFWTDTGGMRLASETIEVRCFESEVGPPA